MRSDLQDACTIAVRMYKAELLLQTDKSAQLRFPNMIETSAFYCNHVLPVVEIGTGQSLKAEITGTVSTFDKHVTIKLEAV